jgi:hypothetical protein
MMLVLPCRRLRPCLGRPRLYQFPHHRRHHQPPCRQSRYRQRPYRPAAFEGLAVAVAPRRRYSFAPTRVLPLRWTIIITVGCVAPVPPSCCEVGTTARRQPWRVHIRTRTRADGPSRRFGPVAVTFLRLRRRRHRHRSHLSSCASVRPLLRRRRHLRLRPRRVKRK